MKILLVTALAAFVLPGCNRKTDPPAIAPAAGTAADSPAAPAGQPPEAGNLTGKWLRPDGGYILEIRSVAAGGKLEAGYFNPGPINVSRAEWRRKDAALEVFVELRDVNYPGSTYTLTYSGRDDRMKGIYYQAALGESYEVEFERRR